MKNFIISTLAITTLAVVPLSASAQINRNRTEPNYENSKVMTISPVELNRAKNWARQAAEEANGGLSQYRAEQMMHRTLTPSEYTNNGDGSLTFNFTGRTPYSSTYTIESVVTVDLNNNEVTVDYNGPIR